MRLLIFVQVHASDVIKGVSRRQLIEFIISLNQLCFINSLQIFAARTPAKTVAFVTLYRVERATSVNANLDTRGPTVNLVRPRLTLFYLYITFHDRYCCTHGCLFVRAQSRNILFPL